MAGISEEYMVVEGNRALEDTSVDKRSTQHLVV